jgi:hypothetical protein
MGRGNYCPSGECADQWYVDYDGYRYDEEEGERCEEIDFDLLQDDMNQALEAIKKRFPSFQNDEKWGDGYWGEKYLLSNKLFRIGMADNQWSAVLFLQMRDDLYPEQENLAGKHFSAYASALRQIMLEVFGEIHIRTSAWTSCAIRREDAAS